MRRKLEPEMKKNNSVKSKNKIAGSKSISSSSSLTSKVNHLKELNVTEENKMSIMNLLSETIDVRNGLRKKCASATEMINMFPHLKEFNGDMIHLEFDSIKSMSCNEGLVQKVIKTDHTFDDILNDDFVKFLAIILIAQKSATTKFHEFKDDEKKCFVRDMLKTLIKWIDQNDDIEDIIEQRQTGEPLLICSSLSEFACGYFNLIIDNTNILLSDKTIEEAFVIFYKSFYVFNLKFPKPLIRFYNFLECYYFKVDNVNPTGKNQKLMETFN